MKLLDITLQNFRNFENYNLSLGKKTTVFIGRNGTGKTNIIEAMVQSLSFIFSKQRDTPQYEFIRSTDQKVKSFNATDPRFANGDYTYPISIKVNASIANAPISWSFEQETGKSGLKDSTFRKAYHLFWEHYKSDEKPLLAFFSDGFPHKNTNLGNRMKEKLGSGNPLPANDGYYQWDKEQSCVNIWKTYFVQQWINNRLNHDDEKEAFVSAINQKLHDFSLPINSSNISNEFVIEELFVEKRIDDTLMIRFEDGSIKPFDSLPAGYERIYSIVLDLASRSYLLNKHTDPDGIVFIDEIELHLHPSLAAEVLTRLQNTFPYIQFIVSTHSPLVISNFNQISEQEDDFRLINLYKTDGGGYSNRIIEDIYGLDYSSSLANIMDTQESEQYEDELIKVYRYWVKKDLEKSKRIAELIRQKYGSTSPIIKKLGL